MRLRLRSAAVLFSSLIFTVCGAVLMPHIIGYGIIAVWVVINVALGVTLSK